MTDPTARTPNRLFVALDPPDGLRAHLASLAEALAVAHGGRAVPAENLHATLAFLGPVETPGVAEVRAELEAGAPRAAVPAHLEGLRVRPGGAARIIAAQVELASADDAVALDRLRVALRDAAGAGGSSEDERPMWLHITLVRFRRPTRPASLPDIGWEQVFGFERITLYDSRPHPSGPPRYEPVAVVDLNAPG